MPSSLLRILHSAPLILYLAFTLSLFNYNYYNSFITSLHSFTSHQIVSVMILLCGAFAFNSFGKSASRRRSPGKCAPRATDAISHGNRKHGARQLACVSRKPLHPGSLVRKTYHQSNIHKNYKMYNISTI